MTKHSDKHRGEKRKRARREEAINERQREREVERWMECVDVADSAGTLPPPTTSTTTTTPPFCLSDPHLHCRVMALGSTTVLRREGHSLHKELANTVEYRLGYM